MITKEITWNSSAQMYYGYVWSEEKNRYVTTRWDINGVNEDPKLNIELNN